MDLEMLSLNIISAVGTARSMYVEAIQEGKKGNIDKARELIAEGEKIFTEGHHAHADLLTLQMDANQLPYMLLLMHSEDQLMSSETMKIVAEEFVDLYEQK